MSELPDDWKAWTRPQVRDAIAEFCPVKRLPNMLYTFLYRTVPGDDTHLRSAEDWVAAARKYGVQADGVSLLTHAIERLARVAPSGE